MDPSPTPVPGEGAHRPRGTSYLLGGIVANATAAYLFNLLGGRVLGPDDFAPISILWTLQFLYITIVSLPVEQVIIQRLTAAGGRREALRPAWPLIVLIVGGGTAATTAVVAATRDRFFQGESGYVVMALVLFAGWGLFAVARGFLGASQRFRAYGLVLAAEAGVRLAAGIAVLATRPEPLPLAWTMATGTWVILLARPFRREPAVSATSTEAGGVVRFVSGLFVGNAASQTLLAAGPLVVGALGASAAAVSVFFVTFTVLRAPLTMTYALVARVLGPLTTWSTAGQHHRIWHFCRNLAGLGVAAAGVAALGAFLLGPAVVTLMFGPEFRPTRLLVALAAGGVVLGGVAFFAGQGLVAQARTRVLAGVWLGALTVAGLLVIPDIGTVVHRVAAAFAVGEAVAMAATLAALQPRFAPSPRVAATTG